MEADDPPATLGTAVNRRDARMDQILNEVSLLREQVQGLRHDLRYGWGVDTAGCSPDRQPTPPRQTASKRSYVDPVAAGEQTHLRSPAETQPGAPAAPAWVPPGVAAQEIYRSSPTGRSGSPSAAEQPSRPPAEPPTPTGPFSREQTPASPAATTAAAPPASASAPGAPPPLVLPQRAGAKRQARKVNDERLLAVGGSFVTLVGAGFLLALAVHAGWFGPALRVASLALLSLALAGGAYRVRVRHAEAAVGLAATAATGGFLVVVACTSLYGWLPDWAGVGLALALALFGAYVAGVWRRELLADLVLAETLLVLPVLLLDPLRSSVSAQPFVLWILFSLVASLAMWPLVRAHNWTRLQSLAVVGLSLVLVLAVIASLLLIHERLWVVAVTAVLVACLMWVACLVRHRTILTAVPLLASLAVAMLTSNPLGGYLAMILAAACALATARYGLARVHVPLGVILFAVATLKLVSAPWWASAFALAALLLLLLPRAREIWWGSVGLSAMGAIALLQQAPPLVLTAPGGIENPLAVCAGALGLVAVGATHVASADQGPSVPSARVRIWAGALLGGYAFATACIALGALLSPGQLGFRVAHVSMTVVVVAISVVLVVRSVRHRGVAAGLLVCAVAKLFLFDLVALDGVLRAVLFLLSGLLILFAATRIRSGATG
ncbi:hypothetical protein [Gephyromycinifex aptenodytis]|uniref:hypothetical protein n=1 Tax=Gephyromycinifex aptenodytis TaxID=2716227 RepID=UPI001444DC07|nr:hypothetical protein [Gephyromycinifex aptenodytis]